MDRQFLCNAAIALCTAWALGCGAAWAQDPPPASDQTQPSDASNLPGTLDGEIARAHALRAKGDYQTATQALGQLLLVAPDNPQIVGEYAKSLIQEGRPDDALPFAKRAIELQSGDWTLYSALGVAYDQLDNHAQARTAYEHALALRPGAPEVLNNYAVSRMLAGDLDGAQRLLAQASAADSGDGKIAANLAMLASMKRPAAAAAPLPAVVAPHATNPSATAAPRAIAAAAPPVIMQKVPRDPLAGPVARSKAPSSRLAQAHSRKAKLAAAKVPHAQTASAVRAPALRTAADNQ